VRAVSNWDVGGEMQLRLFFGRAHMLNPHAYSCQIDDPDRPCGASAVPDGGLLDLYCGGLAIGGSFPILAF
jgi:hypothetical protein